MEKGSQALLNTRCCSWAKLSLREQTAPIYVQNERVTHCSQEIRSCPFWQLHVASSFPSQSHHKLRGTLPDLTRFLVRNHSYSILTFPCETDEQLRTQLQRNIPAIGEVTRGSTFKCWALGQEHGLHKNFFLINCVPNHPLKGAL